VTPRKRHLIERHATNSWSVSGPRGPGFLSIVFERTRIKVECYPDKTSWPYPEGYSFEDCTEWGSKAWDHIENLVWVILNHYAAVGLISIKDGNLDQLQGFKGTLDAAKNLPSTLNTEISGLKRPKKP